MRLSYESCVELDKALSKYIQDLEQYSLVEQILGNIKEIMYVHTECDFRLTKTKLESLHNR